MKRPPTYPSAVRDVLGDVLKRVDPEQQLRAYHLWNFWSDEVGAAIARRAQPARFRNGILFVTVATHSWMQELQFMKDTIRDKLNARLGAALVRDIFFVSGTVEEPAPGPERATPLPTPVAVTPTALPPIADPELAAAFARIVDAQARRAARSARHRPGRTKKPR